VGDPLPGGSLIQGVSSLDPHNHRFFYRDSRLMVVNPQTGTVVANPPFTYRPLFLEFEFPVAQEVSIDIKPGNFPNSINPNSRGKISVAILSSDHFDAPSQVDQSSLTFGATGNESSLAFCSSVGEDVNNDRLPDLICKFYTQQTGFQSGDEQGNLKGNTVDSLPIAGSDSINIVPP